MSDGKHLGKISRVRLGLHPEVDDKVGLDMTFSFGWCVDAWVPLEDANLAKLLQDAKRRTVVDLVNTPVEVVIERGMLKSWRVLTEVL